MYISSVISCAWSSGQSLTFFARPCRISSVIELISCRNIKALIPASKFSPYIAVNYVCSPQIIESSQVGSIQVNSSFVYRFLLQSICRAAIRVNLESNPSQVHPNHIRSDFRHPPHSFREAGWLAS